MINFSRYLLDYDVTMKIKSVLAVPTPDHICGSVLAPHLQNLDSFIPFISELASIIPSLKFTEGWIHHYSKDQFIRKHSDPRSHNGAVIIGVFGDFSGGKFHVGDNIYDVRPGDVMLLRGNDPTNPSLSMPPHWLDPVTSGERYSVILNCIA